MHIINFLKIFKNKLIGRAMLLNAFAKLGSKYDVLRD